MILFCKRLKELRKQAGFTQQQLGNMIGVTKVSICCYENGTRTPTLDTLVDLANSLNTDLAYFLGCDCFVVSEEDSTYGINMATDEIKLIKELRVHIKLYEQLLDDPKRILDYIEKNNKISIMGAGKYSRLLGRKLIDNSIFFEGYVVSDLRNNPNEIVEIMVCLLDENNESGILVGILPIDKKNIMNSLKKNKINNYFFVYSV